MPSIVAKRLRKRPDGGASHVLDAPIYESATIPSHDGGTIHVVNAGTGPPIVLSHGVTLSVRTWVRQLETLPAQGFHVVAFDHRGHGSSTLGESGFSVDNLGDDIRSVVERLDLRDAVLVGHSMGGIAVQSFLLRHPEVAAERVKGVVLLSTLARVPLSGAGQGCAGSSIGSVSWRPIRRGCGRRPTSASSSRDSASVAIRSRATSSSCAR